MNSFCSSALALLLLPTLATSAGLTVGPGDLQPAIAQLRPGDTLVLADGPYPPTSILCGQNAANGTPAQPITLRAQHERQAHLVGDGGGALRVSGCAYWVIEGLYARGSDAPDGSKLDVVTIEDSHHITLRRLLVTHNNRYFNTGGLALLYTHQSLIEENEVYYMHRHGLVNFGGNTGNIVRRNYVHSREYGEIPGGFPTGYTRGTEGISCYPCAQSLFENNIVEGFEGGFTIQSKFNTVGNRYLGNIALNNWLGIGFRARHEHGPTLDSMAQQTEIRDHVVLGNTRHGLLLRGTKGTQVTNATVLDNGGGVTANLELPCCPGDGQPSVFGTNVLVVSNPTHGVALSSQAAAGFDFVNLWQDGGNDWGGASVTNLRQQDPQLGSCKVWIPTSSPMKGAGRGGADIGANVLYRYEGGILTKTPLWKAPSGTFSGCGAIVPGVNDQRGVSCYDVHVRLNVNSNGCMLPAGYGNNLPSPYNLRAVSR